MNKIALYIVLLNFLCFGCEMRIIKKNVVNDIANPFAKSEWSSKLEKDTSEMRTSWLNSSNPFSFSGKEYQDMGLNVFMEGDDPSKMIVIPIVVYKIKYQPFLNWNGVSHIKNIMELSKNNADCFIANKKEIKCIVQYRLEENKWFSNGWGPLDKRMTNVLSKLYFENELNTIMIYVETSSERKPYLKNFIIYEENGKYMQVKNAGEVTPFIPDLIKFQKVLISGETW